MLNTFEQICEVQFFFYYYQLLHNLSTCVFCMGVTIIQLYMITGRDEKGRLCVCVCVDFKGGELTCFLTFPQHSLCFVSGIISTAWYGSTRLVLFDFPLTNVVGSIWYSIIRGGVKTLQTTQRK